MRALALAGVLAATGCAATPASPAAGTTAAGATGAATGLQATARAATAPGRCADDAGWNDPATPRHVHGSTWYVGTCGITALLVTSDAGHVLLDAGTAEAAPQVMANIRALGFRVEDVRYLLSSHAHVDHAGGFAALQRASGATLVALDAALPALRSGLSTPADPQHGALPDFTGVGTGATRPIADGDVLRLGPLAFTAHATPGHAPGGTSWTWRSCEAGACLDIAFVDSLTAVSAPTYRFSDAASHPQVLPAFEASFGRVRALPCDLLLTPHPRASALWSRLGPGATRPLAEPGACLAYADAAERRLEFRLAEERATP
ncbi:MAG: subclass B3 metallo-beta-lactamase [Pseudomonadota bacterium]